MEEIFNRKTTLSGLQLAITMPLPLLLFC